MTTAMYISEGLAAIIATVFYYKYRHLPVRLILIILWTAVLTEIGASAYTHYIYPNNHWVYNLYSFIFYTLIFKMVYDHINNRVRKKIVASLAVLTIIGIILRAMTTSVLTRYMTSAYNLAMAVMVIISLFYAIDRLQSDAPLKPKKELELFIFGAYLLFGISFIPISWFRVGQLGTEYSQSFHDNLLTIQGVVLIVMNSLLIVGFIWTRPLKTKRQ